MLLSQGLRAIQVALIAGCAVMLFSGVSPLLSASGVDEIRLPDPRPATARDTTFARYQVIGERNLFLGDDSSAVLPPPIVPEVLPESKLPWRLLGTIAMTDARQSVATLENTRRDERDAYRIGEALEAGVELVGIERRRVRISNRGVEQQISMEDDASAGAGVRKRVPTRSRASSRSARPSRAQRTRRSPRAARDRLQELKRQARRPAAEADAAAERAAAAAASAAEQERLEQFMSSAQMTPMHDEDGNFVGLTLDEVKPDGPLASMAPGTVCHDLNGVSLSQMHLALQELGAEQPACVQCTLPDGTQQTACF